MEQKRKTFMEKLLAVQSRLKAPKSCYNAFGKYNYRNCEDILEAVKPLLTEEELILTITDEVVSVSDRIYIKATATVDDGINSKTVSAFAREPIEKKGMDVSQVSGASSSYARKYALNGLFLIDDTKDADSDMPAVKQNVEPPTVSLNSPTTDQLKTLKTLNIDIKKIAVAFGKLEEELTKNDIAQAIKMKRESIARLKG